ncbi:MAG: NUDIX pyrophosphatase [Actinomycetia bacterium]|nr:NUDIX pyrophosphatase [Actinomycetes bacterium]
MDGVGRQPVQVLVMPYAVAPGHVSYGVLRRADGGQWQGVAGGADGVETPLEAATRETGEELGLVGAEFRVLDARASVPADCFAGWERWLTLDPPVYVVPEHAFAVLVPDPHRIVLSREHDAILWLPYGDARRLLTWDSNRTALWELRQRLLADGVDGA